MSPERLKSIAARLVADGIKRSAALNQQAFKEFQMAKMMNKHEGNAVYLAARLKIKRAKRILTICGRLAAAHGVGPQSKRPGTPPRPLQENPNIKSKREDNTCVTKWQ